MPILEALSLRPQDLHLASPAHVKLMGKGQKERISPIWPETAELISELLRRRPRRPDVRHTTAVHLISAGVDVTVIRSWLGHASLDTTYHYAQASLETKRKALEKVDSKLHSTKPPRWKRDADLLAWLDSL